MHVYDLVAGKPSLTLEGHDDDINSVCFADDSGNVLLSGSDDSLIKVWDRRSLGDNTGVPSGILIGTNIVRLQFQTSRTY